MKIMKIEIVKLNKHMFKPIDFFHRIFSIIPGFYFGFLYSLIFGVSISIGFLFQIFEDPSFSIFTHWISHLSLGCKMSRICFIVGLCLGSPFIFIFQNFLLNSFFDKYESPMFPLFLYGAGLTQSIGLFFAGIIPLNFPTLHGFAANLFFFGALIYYSGLFFLLIKNKRYSYCGIFFSSLCMITTSLFIFAGIFNTLTRSCFPFGLNYSLEWLTITSHLAGNIFLGLEFFNSKKQKEQIFSDKNDLVEENVIVLPKEIVLIRKN